MPNSFRSRPSRGTVFRVLTVGTVVLLVLVIAVGAWLYIESIRTFEVRRVSLPTRIYTDITPLEAGAPLTADALSEKLDRLGYHESKSLEAARDLQKGRRRVGNPSSRLPSSDGGPGTRGRAPVRGPRPRCVRRRHRRRDGGARARTGAARLPHGGAAGEPEPREARRGPAAPRSTRSSSRRTRASCSIRESTRSASSARSFGTSAPGATAGGWVDAHPAAGEELLPDEREDAPAEDDRGVHGGHPRRQVLEERDHRGVPQRHLSRTEPVDLDPGSRRGVALLFRQARFGDLDRGSRAARGDDPSPNNYSPFVDAARAKARRDTVLRQMEARKKITTELRRRRSRRTASGEAVPGAERARLDSVLRRSRPSGDPARLRRRRRAGPRPQDLHRDRSRLAGRRDTGARARASQAREVEPQAAPERRSAPGGDHRRRRPDRRDPRARRRAQLRPEPVQPRPQRAASGRLALQAVRLSRRVRAAALAPEHHAGDARQRHAVRPRAAVLEGLVAAQLRRALPRRRHGAAGARAVAERRVGAPRPRDRSRIDHQDGERRSASTRSSNRIPALILGAVDVSPIEMAEAYTTLARLGSRMPLRAIRYVTDDDGDLDLPVRDPARAGLSPARRLPHGPPHGGRGESWDRRAPRGTSVSASRPRERPERRTTSGTRGSSGSPPGRWLSPGSGSTTTSRWASPVPTARFRSGPAT